MDSEKQLPSVKRLSVPYLSQLDNLRNPHGSCNVTSIAAVLTYFKFKNPTGGQLEDYLYDYMEKNGLGRHSGYDLARLFNLMAGSQDIAYKDEFVMTASLAQIKRQIVNGFPVVLHGYLTDFGHVITCSGYDDSAYGGKGALICQDPYGEWFPSGYRDGGKDVLYSYNLIRAVFQDHGDDTSIWAHLISKK